MCTTPPPLPPRGVCASVWRYVHTPHIAEDYDTYFAFNRLFDLDRQVLERYVRSAGLVVDLGCGTGRSLVPLARRGLRGVAVDLSPTMLNEVEKKARRDNLSIQCVRGNIVELEWLADRCADYVICLFSTLGMVHGSENRHRVLHHARRVLKPGGLLFLHVHNFWFSLYDPAEFWWLAKNMLQAAVVRNIERGDKQFEYRGIPAMYLHVYTFGELRRSLHRAGFRMCDVIHLNGTRRRSLRWPWLLGAWRANGWIVVGQRPTGL